MEKTIVDFDDVSFSYGSRTDGSLKNISLTVKEGEFVLFTGQSGSGKTTVMRLINGLIPHFFEGTLSGRVSVFGKDTKTASPGELGKKSASIFQNPRSQFFTANSTSEAAFACENYGIDRVEMIERVDTAFHDFNAEYLMDRDMFSLSSGEKQKVAIIAAKTLHPQLYVFDEPSANLDIRSIMQLKEMMRKLKDAGHTVVVSEHRLFYLQNLCDRCLILHEGRIIKALSKSDMEHMNTADLERYNMRAFDLNTIGFTPQYEKTKKQKRADFQIKNLSFSYRASASLLENCCLEGNYGDTIAVIGDNGQGKTTLGKIISGLLKSKEGYFFLDGKRIKQKELYKSVYFVMQDADYQLYSDSVLSELQLSGGLFNKGTVEEIEKVMKVLHIFEYKEEHPWALSGGQKQRVTIAAAMTAHKRIIVFDEPTSGLDYENMKAVSEAINTLRKQGTLNFVISHDVEFLSRVATKAIFIEHAKISGSVCLERDSDFERVKKFLLQGSADAGLFPLSGVSRREEDRYV